MGKPQIAIRIPPSLLSKLNYYVEQTGTSKTDVVVSAIAQYLDCSNGVSLSQRVANLEAQVKELQDLTKIEMLEI